jgi:hypothetical protein
MHYSLMAPLKHFDTFLNEAQMHINQTRRAAIVP